MSEITIHNVEQRSPEWHALRSGKIGGSEAIGLTTPARMKTLLYKKAGEILAPIMIDDDEEIFISKAMQRGIDLEPEALDRYFQMTGNFILPCGYVTNSDYIHAGVSPDGMTSDYRIAAEVKCLSRDKHVETFITQKVPSDYMPQIAWYFFIMPALERVDFIMYHPDFMLKSLYVIEVSREDCIDFTPLYNNFVEQLNNVINQF